MNETSRFGDLHTKTYDIELLISGALVFGLFNVPGEMDRLFDRWGPRLDGLASPALTYLYTYGQIIVYSMLATFILHLALRGYWIALLGLESVWHDGWSWDRLKLGPYSRERLEQRVPSLSRAINTADDRASMVFAAGAMLVMTSLYSVGIVLTGLAIGFAVEAATGISGPRVFFIAIACLFLAAILPALLDRRFGRRITADTRAGRVFGRVVHAGLLVSPVRWTAPIQFMFQSRIGERRLSIALGISAGIMAAAMVLSLVLRTGVLRLDSWRYYDPAPSAASIDPRFYRDSGAARDGRRPTIDSDVIAGPVLRLYLPYRPRRHNPRIAQACPELASAVAKGDAPDNAASAACLGGLYKVSLDANALTPEYRFTRDAQSDFVGLLAYLPTAGLAPGPHTLTVDIPGSRADAEREIVRIPFYSVPR